MADLDQRARAPFTKVARSGRFGTGTPNTGLVIEERTNLTLATVMSRRAAEQNLKRAVVAAYGLDLPDGPRAAVKDGVSFAGIGVGQWLAAAETSPGGDFISHLRKHLAGLASIVDQSDGRVVLRLSGDRARDVLAKGIPLDLHPRNFRTGDVASTMVAYIGIQIQQIDDRPAFQLMAFRSFAGSLLSWLTKSAAEYGYEIQR
jgi:methylglutamate dehydrogenase subunit D